jgi:hypothetical protein
MIDDLVRVRVVDEAHPVCGEIGTATLSAFQAAARRGLEGRFAATFANGSALVRFAQVELDPERLDAAVAAGDRSYGTAGTGR